MVFKCVNNALNCQDNVALAVQYKTEQIQSIDKTTLTRKRPRTGKNNLSQCNFVYQKSQMSLHDKSSRDYVLHKVYPIKRP